MGPTCLSDGSCKQLCNTCIESYERYVKSVTENEIRKSINYLESHGYVVISPKEVEK